MSTLPTSPPPLALGAPGIYRLPETSPPVLGGVRLDVCAFVGVAPRGPARQPRLEETFTFERPCVEPGRPRERSVAVAVESFDEYRRLFGGFEGPGRLPYAVAQFFEQGGRRAYVVRIVHRYGRPADMEGVAEGIVSGALPSVGDLRLRVRSEGAWGNGLRAGLGYSAASLVFEFDPAEPGQLVLDRHEPLPLGSLLRFDLPGGVTELRFVRQLRIEPRPAGLGEQLLAQLEAPLPAVPRAAQVIAGELLLDDGDGRRERHEDLGLTRSHPRWMGTILCFESELVYPHPQWVEGELRPEDPDQLPREVRLPPAADAGDEGQFQGGEDRWRDLVPEDFFDAGWVLGDPEPGSGIHALTHADDLALVCVPDLYSHAPLAEREEVVDPPSFAGPEFGPCVEAPLQEEQEESPPDLPGLHLDPGIPADLEAIITLQQRVVRLAEETCGFVALLDVPAGLTHRRVLAWRGRFSSSYAAAYHPWLRTARPDDSRNALLEVNPSAAAAGIIARRELDLGIPHGPANVLAATVVDLVDEVSPQRHDELHPLGVNVFQRERDGILLTAGRTLSKDPRYRQLTVRRLMMMLKRVLQRQTLWMVFEPNGPELQAQVRQMLRAYLRQLFIAGAFRGATEDEAFFVRCDAGLNPPRVSDAGRLIAEIGVAPSEPVEFIVLSLVRGGDGSLTVEG